MAKVDAKVVLLGKEYGGKTSLMERFLHNRFCGDDIPYQNTIGAAYGAKRVEVFGRYVYLGIWDTAGSERYQAMSRIYYRSAWAAVVCYDLTERSSWEKAKFWVNELRQNEPRCRLYFCGTKLDLLENDPTQRQIEERQVKEFLTSNLEAGDVAEARIFEISSKTGEGVSDVFLQIAKDFIKLCANRPRPSVSDEPLSLNNQGMDGGDRLGSRKCNC